MYYITNNELYHYGIMGQKWGVRRFQNPDGTLTVEGRRRYGVERADSPKTNAMQRGLVSYKASHEKYKQSVEKKEQKALNKTKVNEKKINNLEKQKAFHDVQMQRAQKALEKYKNLSFKDQKVINGFYIASRLFADGGSYSDLFNYNIGFLGVTNKYIDYIEKKAQKQINN